MIDPNEPANVIPGGGCLHTGISTRAEIASRIMAGLCANPGGPFQANGASGWGFTNCGEHDIAALSVNLADALIAKLNES